MILLQPAKLSRSTPKSSGSIEDVAPVIGPVRTAVGKKKKGAALRPHLSWSN